MRVIARVAIAIIAVTLAVVGSATSQSVFVDVWEIQGLTAAGEIPEGGTDLVIPVHFQNAGDARTAISNGWHDNFFAPGMLCGPHPHT